jgi:hypothetical protein
MEASTEFWSGFVSGVFTTMGGMIVLSLVAAWALIRNAPVAPDHWDA